MRFFHDIFRIFVDEKEKIVPRISPVSKYSEYRQELSEIYFDDIFVATEYKYIKDDLEQYKFYSERHFARIFSEFLEKTYVEVLSIYGEQRYMLTSVPMHWTRYFVRGFDHMKFLVKKLSRKIKVPHKVLLGTRFTKRQVKLSREERLKNRKNIYFPKIKENIPKVVLLVDDVVTTASSINECSRVLKEMGVQKIIVIVLASNK